MNTFKAFIFAIILSLSAYGALPATSVFEVHNNGSNTNAGCFISTGTGTDRSQQDAAQTTYTDLVAPTTTTITSAGHPFGSTDVGNCLRISSGSGWTTGLYYVVSVASTTATVDRAIATASSTGGNGKLGGAIATLAQLNTDMIGGSIAWVKADSTYSMASGVTLNFTSNSPTQINGYTTTRGDNGKPTLQASAGSITLITVSFYGKVFRNFTLDCNTQANSKGLAYSSYSTAENIRVTNCTLTGISLNQTFVTCRFCTVTGNTQAAQFAFAMTGFQDMTCYACTAISNVSGGFSMDGGKCRLCVAVGSSGSNADGFQIGPLGSALEIENSIAYGNNRYGVNMTGTSANATPFTILNTIIANNGSGGIITASVIPANGWTMDYNGFYSNGTNYTNVSAGAHDVILSGNPFTNAGSGDFSLNSTAGAGAALRGVGYPGVTSFGTGGNSIGPLEPVSSGSSGSIHNSVTTN